MLYVPLWLFITIIALLPLALAGGYELAVHNWREKQNNLQQRYVKLSLELGKLADQMKSDPYRAGIDTGRGYILDQMTALIRRLQEEA